MVQFAAPMAKGSNLTGLLFALEHRFGAETVARVLAAVPPELGQALQSGGVVSDWYPLEWYKLLHQVAQQVTGQESKLAWDLAHDFVHHQLGGIYKALLKMISPNWLFKYPSMIFSRYFSHGTLTVPENRPGFVRGSWSGCAGFDRNIWYATFGGCQAALERAGAKDVQVQIVSGAGDGDTQAVAEGHWL
jgi:hypothetical protein